jgi:hypothetical protein
MGITSKVKEAVLGGIDNLANLLAGTAGKVSYDSLLTARVFTPIDTSMDVDFLKAHPVTRFPELYREDVKQKRTVRNKCITTAYVTFLAAQHQTESSAIGDFKYHDSGTGTGDEAVGDTGLGTPWGGSRDIGTQVASTNTYTSVATTTYNATKAITEHGLFNASTNGTLMDRSKFDAINVVPGNQIIWTYVLTLTAGG